MGLEVPDNLRSECVIVVMDANKNKGNVDALDWALKHVVRRKDTVIVLGVLCEFGKKNSCFPLNIGIGFSGIWERLEFSSHGQEVRPRELGEEIERKKEQYQNILQPFYKQCKKNELKLEVKLAFGFCPQKITVEQAQNSNPRWIVLDSNLKKYKSCIHEHVGCSIAVMKRKVATLTTSRPLPRENPPRNISTTTKNQNDIGAPQPTVSSRRALSLQSPSWHPLSERCGFPRAFSQAEIESITSGFAEENIVLDEDSMKVYEGMLQEAPVLVQSFSDNDERFWTTFKILSRVRHRNIMSLVGYCCTGTSMFLLSDYPYMGTLEKNLQSDVLARELPWKARWCIALEIGGSLRYLHEECVDGAIVHLSVCSPHVVLLHGCSTTLSNFITARWLKDETPSDDDSQVGLEMLVADELLSIDIRDYGIFLIELITGKSAQLFPNQERGRTLIEWALPLLEDGPMSELLDPRLEDINDARVVDYMATAALLCLKNNDSGHRISMSEVLAVVRGDQLAITKC